VAFIIKLVQIIIFILAQFTSVIRGYR